MPFPHDLLNVAKKGEIENKSHFHRACAVSVCWSMCLRTHICVHTCAHHCTEYLRGSAFQNAGAGVAAAVSVSSASAVPIRKPCCPSLCLVREPPAGPVPAGDHVPGYTLHCGRLCIGSCNCLATTVGFGRDLQEYLIYSDGCCLFSSAWEVNRISGQSWKMGS
jgi:hypothetical protein